MKKRSREFVTLAEINVTNLVDVTLVLLIIFMITAPIMRAGMEVNLPETKATHEINLEKGLTITLTKDGVVMIENRPVALTEFRKEIEPLIASGNIKEVYIQGDNAVPYGIVVRVMGELKNLGIEDVGLVAEPEAPGTERKKRK